MVISALFTAFHLVPIFSLGRVGVCILVDRPALLFNIVMGGHADFLLLTKSKCRCVVRCLVHIFFYIFLITYCTLNPKSFHCICIDFDDLHKTVFMKVYEALFSFLCENYCGS